jgi:hypothetical protein
VPTPFAVPSPLPTPTPLTGIEARPVPFALPQPSTRVPTQADRCPPCQEELPEPRDACFKKLVKEGITPDLDESFNWVEIDCFTGREL